MYKSNNRNLLSLFGTALFYLVLQGIAFHFWGFPAAIATAVQGIAVILYVVVPNLERADQ